MLTPLAPSPGSKFHVDAAGGIIWQRGPYNGWWLRIPVGNTLSSEQLLQALKDGMARAAKVPSPGAPLYVVIEEMAADPSVLGTLREQAFRFHHFHEGLTDGKSRRHLARGCANAR